MKDIFQILKTELNTILQGIVKDSRANLKGKGHFDTGELHNSVGAKVDILKGNLLGAISFLDYGLAQDTGIKPDRIPYSRGSGGSRSKYISGLQAWVQRKGMASNNKEAKSIAFAIANAHKKAGMHTSNRGKFDKSKQGWFSDVVKQKEGDINAAIDLAVGNSLELVIGNLVDEANRNKGK